MKIEIFDTKQFVDINELEPVTSPIIFQRGNVPDPNGLLSTRIFGVSVKSRKNQFSYIDLSIPFFNPHVYKAFKRFFRNIEYIVNGSKYFSIDDKGKLYEDPENGETGLEWIYKNWEKIKWELSLEDSPMRKERVNLLTKSKKNVIFTRYQIVVPVFYRDVMLKDGGGGETDPLNNFYSKQIRLVSLLKDRDMFDFTMHSTIWSIQNLMVEIYDTFKKKLEKKNGLIRKFLMGKSPDNCARSVISCPIYHSDRPEDTPARFGHVGVPISQICSLCSPFMQYWLKNFFEREFIQKQEIMTTVVDGEQNFVKLYKPELYFTDKYIKTMLDRFIHDPESRFMPIQVPIGKDKFMNVNFTGKHLDPSGTHELSTIADRPMTVTDLLYVAAVDVTKGRHAMVTRYPMDSAYNSFFGYIDVISTSQTEVVNINGVIYRNYPKVDMGIKRSVIPIRFIDSVQFSNSYLAGMGGDYDGDQITIKIPWTMEANEDCERAMNDKTSFVQPDGSNARPIKFECLQTMYDITKDPDKNSIRISDSDKKELLEHPAYDYTFTYITSLIADKMKNGKRVKSRFNVNDIVVLNVGEYHNSEKIETTVGRIIWNKVMVDRLDFWKFFRYFNKTMTKKTYVGYEAALTLLLREDAITTDQFRNYIDHRDWFGLILNGIVTTSFTPATVKTPESVKKLKDELFKKYEKELAAGDTVTANKVEKALIDATVEAIKDDPGFDLYASGARGDINNHLKNIFLMRGGVLNPNTGKFEIMKTSFNDGLLKEDFTAAFNSVVQGAYSKSVATRDSGYSAKQLLSGTQTEIIDEDGSDCGTETTLDIFVTPEIKEVISQRYIKVNDKPVLLNSKNIDKYEGKTIKLYSPMCCKRTKKGFICEKCAGKQESKAIGLDTNKLGTTLVNAGMKKFHDSTLRFFHLDVNNMLVNVKGGNIFSESGNDVVVNTKFDIMIPMDYFDKGFATDLGNMIEIFGIVPVGVYTSGSTITRYDCMNIPTKHKYFVYDNEVEKVDLPGLGMTNCRILHYIKGHRFCPIDVLKDQDNATAMLGMVTYGKIPPVIPYKKSLELWCQNAILSNVNFGVPLVIQEVVLSCSYRYKKDPTKKFAEVYGKDPNLDQFEYEMASIRRICQLTSTFTGVTFEDFDSSVTMSLNRARDGKEEAESPLEELFKL